MKKLFALAGILLVGYFAQLIFPWWIIWFVCLLVFLILNIKAQHAIWLGFAGSFLLWFLMAYYLDKQNDHLLSEQIGLLFGGLSSFSLCLVTGIVGGLLGALGGITGALGRKIITKS